MPGQSPPSDSRPPSPESVRRSLRFLAEGSAANEELAADGRTFSSESDAFADDAIEADSPDERANPKKAVLSEERTGGCAERTVPDPERTVRDAERAVECARAAAAFLVDGRLPVLERAVGTAAARGDADVARRGRRARATLRRLHVALGCRDPDDGTEPQGGADPDGGDHFRSARGTVIPRREKGTGR